MTEERMQQQSSDPSQEEKQRQRDNEARQGQGSMGGSKGQVRPFTKNQRAIGSLKPDKCLGIDS